MSRIFWDDSFVGNGANTPLENHAPNIPGSAGTYILNAGSPTTAYVLATGEMKPSTLAQSYYKWAAPATQAQSTYIKVYCASNASEVNLYLRFDESGSRYFFARFGISGTNTIKYSSGGVQTTLYSVPVASIPGAVFTAGYPYGFRLSIDASNVLTAVITDLNDTVIATYSVADTLNRIPVTGSAMVFMLNDVVARRLTSTDEFIVTTTATFSGTIPNKTGTAGSAFAFGTPTAASYFTGSGLVYSTSVALPTGLSIDTATGVISGTPAAAGTWSGTIVATGAGGAASSNTLSITIAAVVPSAFTGTIPSKTGTAGSVFAFGTPTAASYFTGTSLVFSTSVTLPTGLSIDSATGIISGTPSAAGTWSGTIVATGSSGAASSNSFTVTIAAASPAPSPAPATAATITSEPFKNWGAGQVLANQLVENIAVLPVAGGSAVLTLSNQSTDSSGRLVISSTLLSVGSSYMLATWNTGGSVRGLKPYVAA